MFKSEFFTQLKGHCHAIWQLYEKLGGVNSKTNDPVLLLRLFEGTETVSRHLSLRMTWMEMD